MNDQMIFLSQIQNVWYVIMINAEANMILAMNESSSASDKMITSLRSQNVWYIIIISTEANMILAMNKLSLIYDKIISHDKILTSSEASSA